MQNSLLLSETVALGSVGGGQIRFERKLSGVVGLKRIPFLLLYTLCLFLLCQGIGCRLSRSTWASGGVMAAETNINHIAFVSSNSVERYGLSSSEVEVKALVPWRQRSSRRLQTVASTSSSSSLLAIKGIGSPSNLPFMREVGYAYSLSDPSVVMTQDQAKSAAAIKGFLSGNYSFVTLLAQITPADAGNITDLQLYPLAASAVVVVANIPGLSASEDLILSRQSLVDIFEGRIRYWNDSRIVQDNRDNPIISTQLQSIRQPIYIIARSDSAVTTEIFMNALKSFAGGTLSFNTSTDSKKFPTSRYINPANNRSCFSLYPNNDGVVSGVLSTNYSLSYVLWSSGGSQSNSTTGMRILSLVNRFGLPVKVGVGTVQAAILEKSTQLAMRNQRNVTLIDCISPTCWPLTYLLNMYVRTRNRPVEGCQSKAATVGFFVWYYMSSISTKLAVKNNYITLPESLRVELAQSMQREVYCGTVPAFYYGINGVAAPPDIATPFTLYSTTYALLRPSAGISFQGWKGSAAEAMGQVASGSLPLAILPRFVATELLSENDSYDGVSLLDFPVATMGLSVIYNHPDFQIAAGNATLILSTEVVLRILAGEIQNWNHSDIRRLNTDWPAALMTSDNITVILYESAQRQEYDMLYHVAGSFPTLRSKIFPSGVNGNDADTRVPGSQYTLALPSKVQQLKVSDDLRTLQARVQTTKYSLAIQLLLNQTEPYVPFAQLDRSSITPDAASLSGGRAIVAPNPDTIRACLSNNYNSPATQDNPIRRNGTALWTSTSSSCWPWSFELSAIIPAAYDGDECQDLGNVILPFFAWILGQPKAQVATFELSGVAALSPDAAQAVVDGKLRKVSCLGTGNSIFNTGECRPADIVPVRSECDPLTATITVSFAYLEPKQCVNGLQPPPNMVIDCGYWTRDSPYGVLVSLETSVILAVTFACLAYYVYKRYHPVFASHRILLGASLVLVAIRQLSPSFLFNSPTSLSCGAAAYLAEVPWCCLLTVIIAQMAMDWFAIVLGQSKAKLANFLTSMLLTSVFVLVILAAVLVSQGHVSAASAVVPLYSLWSTEVPTCQTTSTWNTIVTSWSMILLAVGVFISINGGSINRHLAHSKSLSRALNFAVVIDLLRRFLEFNLASRGHSLSVPVIMYQLISLENLAIVLIIMVPKLLTARSVSSHDHRYRHVDVSKWAETNGTDQLRAALQDILIKSRFREYLAAEFAVENLLFLDAVQRFKDTFSAEKHQRVFQDIVGEFIAAGSPNQINISSRQRTELMKLTHSDPEKLPEIAFDIIEEEILKLLLPTFQRFLRLQILLQKDDNERSQRSRKKNSVGIFGTDQGVRASLVSLPGQTQEARRSSSIAAVSGPPLPQG